MSLDQNTHTNDVRLDKLAVSRDKHTLYLTAAVTAITWDDTTQRGYVTFTHAATHKEEIIPISHYAYDRFAEAEGAIYYEVDHQTMVGDHHHTYTIVASETKDTKGNTVKIAEGYYSFPSNDFAAADINTAIPELNAAKTIAVTTIVPGTCNFDVVCFPTEFGSKVSTFAHKLAILDVITPRTTISLGDIVATVQSIHGTEIRWFIRSAKTKVKKPRGIV